MTRCRIARSSNTLQSCCLPTLPLLLLLSLLPATCNAWGVGGPFHRELAQVRELDVVTNFGPCSAPAATINIFNENDFQKRILLPNTTTVILVIQNNITLSRSVFFTSNFSCTLVRPEPSNPNPPWLVYNNNNMPALRVQGATNIVFTGISFAIKINITDMPECKPVLPEFPSIYTCPAIYLYRTWQVTITQGSVYGRTDIYRSGATHIDYMNLYNNFTDRSNRQSFSVVRISLCGDPVQLVRSNIRITNNDISGSFTPVLLYYGAVGVFVTNNYIHDFIFGGIQCGLGMRNVADCMLNTIQDNYIYLQPPLYFHSDGSQIYYDLHWYNPGNMDSCNYMVGGMHCYYLDYCTSGVRIKGGVCYRTTDGVKINTGKNNVIDSLLIVNNPQQSGILSCQNWCINNCNSWASGVGIEWVRTYRAKYDNDLWRANWPYLTDICERTQYNGVSCNSQPQVDLAKNWTGECFTTLDVNPVTSLQRTASANITGNCSGIPTLNDVSLISINGSRRWPIYDINCDAIPNMRLMNKYSSQVKNYPTGYFNFDDPDNVDYGVSDLGSNIYQLYPDFLSCPRENAGPQLFSGARLRSYKNKLSSYNSEPADWWKNTYANVPFSGDSWEVFPRKARVPGEKTAEVWEAEFRAKNEQKKRTKEEKAAAKEKKRLEQERKKAEKEAAKKAKKDAKKKKGGSLRLQFREVY